MKYLKFLVVPLVVLLVMAAQLTSLLLREELPVLRVEWMGQGLTGREQSEREQSGWLRQL